MPVRAVDTTRLYQQVAQQIENLIRGGEFAVGSRLPAERELIKQFGVSRSVLREALIVLELKGFVEIRIGAGTYILKADDAPPVEGPPSAPFEDTGAFDLLMARRMIEAEVARLAALTATPQDVAKLRAALDQMKRDIEPYMLRHTADRAFHIAIAESTRNPALVFIVSGFWDRYRKLMIHQASELARRPENREPAIADHEAIYRCLAERDGDGAAAAMQAHLDRVGRFLSSYRKPDPGD